MLEQMSASGILTTAEFKYCQKKFPDVNNVVETNVKRKYRTYGYGNPQLANCDEAKRILLIETILSEEFQIPPPPK